MILWDIASGERVRTFEGHDRGLACIEFKVGFRVSSSSLDSLFGDLRLAEDESLWRNNRICAC
jgi:WD40 repeat protein